jgi:hypothetical protein
LSSVKGLLPKSSNQSQKLSEKYSPLPWWEGIKGRGKGHSNSCAEDGFDIIEPKLDGIVFLTGLSGKEVKIGLRDSVRTEAREGELTGPFIELLEEQVTTSGNVGIMCTGEHLPHPRILDEHEVVQTAQFSKALDVHTTCLSHQRRTHDAVGNREQSSKGCSKAVYDSEPRIGQCDSGKESGIGEG